MKTQVLSDIELNFVANLIITTISDCSQWTVTEWNEFNLEFSIFRRQIFNFHFIRDHLTINFSNVNVDNK